MYSTIEIKKRFIDFYRLLNYKILPGSSLLDPSVPMTFVMSAGLVQVETSAMLNGGKTHNQYALIQNCFRYFDMERIGKSNAHLSLFQMSGAFSFMNADRQSCISCIWKLLTQVYHLPPESLWITFFSGGRVAGYFFEPDIETYEAWLKAGVNPGKIIGLNQEHNFWKQGTNIVGREHAPKCGPHTEVFYDRGECFKCSPECRPGCKCGRFIEIMNTLFITFHIDDNFKVKTLGEPFTETVIGLERLAMVLQDVPSIFEIDTIKPLIEQIDFFINSPGISQAEQYKHKCIIADHIRAILFLTADGAPPPGKGGRARLMRKLTREMLTSRIFLDINSLEFIQILIKSAINLYSEHQPGLLNAENKTFEYIYEEKQRFEHTLKYGKYQLDRLMQKNKKNWISGEEMVRMEKNHGIPNNLLEKILYQRQISFNYQDYKQAYEQWRQS
ncbi:Alanyl-tRNA synthetase N-terminal domain-containing protein [Desulfonema limicola]|uniref:Alanine--tRNA ligase n=1 Tax=Desulfonema limicola TaxID=45656 RepID=A0A975BDH1_9BACT|nr:alanine--tRNA ligase-related protein [Desulfonema limicola]QTA83303.1 Alanyl-tRNA synthetase N-terminal domain-containing protein [Desulfonema limicola]